MEWTLRHIRSNRTLAHAPIEGRFDRRDKTGQTEPSYNSPPPSGGKPIVLEKPHPSETHIYRNGSGDGNRPYVRIGYDS